MAELAQINQAISNLQAAHGVSLSRDDVQALGELIDGGWEPDEAFSALDLDRDGTFDSDFEAAVAAIEQEQGRTLLDSELDRVWSRAVKASEDPAVETAETVWAEARREARDLSDPDQRAEHIGEMFGGRPETPETVETPADLGDRDSVASYIDARMAGAEPIETGDE